MEYYNKYIFGERYELHCGIRNARIILLVVSFALSIGSWFFPEEEFAWWMKICMSLLFGAVFGYILWLAIKEWNFPRYFYFDREGIHVSTIQNYERLQVNIAWSFVVNCEFVDAPDSQFFNIHLDNGTTIKVSLQPFWGLPKKLKAAVQYYKSLNDASRQMNTESFTYSRRIDWKAIFWYAVSTFFVTAGSAILALCIG